MTLISGISSLKMFTMMRLMPRLTKGVHSSGLASASAIRWMSSSDVTDKDDNMDAMQKEHAKEIADIMHGYEERKRGSRVSLE